MNNFKIFIILIFESASAKTLEVRLAFNLANGRSYESFCPNLNYGRRAAAKILMRLLTKCKMGPNPPSQKKYEGFKISLRFIR